MTGTEARVDLPSWLLDDVALLPVNMIRQERRAREVAGDLVKRLSAGELRLRVQRYCGPAGFAAVPFSSRSAVRSAEPVHWPDRFR
ncbi:hypothetical protein ACXIZN_09830 [Amycolatopsis sp. TRM77291]